MSSHIHLLRARLRAIEEPRNRRTKCVPLGTPQAEEMPGEALVFGRMHELGGPAATLFAGLLLARTEGPVLWCLHERPATAPYGPALSQMGLDPARLVFVRLWRADELMHAAEEGLRAGWHVVLETPKAADLVQSRRLQLAAEAGGGLGLVMAPDWTGETPLLPSAATRWRAGRPGGAVWPACPRLDLSLLRRRGGQPGQWSVEWDHASRTLSVVSPAASQPPRAPRSALA